MDDMTFIRVVSSLRCCWSIAFVEMGTKMVTGRLANRHDGLNHPSPRPLGNSYEFFIQSDSPLRRPFSINVNCIYWCESFRQQMPHKFSNPKGNGLRCSKQFADFSLFANTEKKTVHSIIACSLCAIQGIIVCHANGIAFFVRRRFHFINPNHVWNPERNHKLNRMPKIM